MCLACLSPNKLSPGNPPACRPPKGRRAARSRLSVLASSGSHPACRCPHLDYRPHVVCVNRAAGIVALSPFHAPAVPFAAAAIPPNSHPLSLSPLKGRARCFFSARGSRAGERLKKKERGCAPYPHIARAISSRRIPVSQRVANVQPLSSCPAVFPKKPRSALSRLRSCRRRRLARTGVAALRLRGVTPCCCAGPVPGGLSMTVGVHIPSAAICPRN